MQLKTLTSEQQTRLDEITAEIKQVIVTSWLLVARRLREVALSELYVDYGSLERWAAVCLRLSPASLWRYLHCLEVYDRLVSAGCEIQPTNMTHLLMLRTVPIHEQAEVWRDLCRNSELGPFGPCVTTTQLRALTERYNERTVETDSLGNPLEKKYTAIRENTIFRQPAAVLRLFIRRARAANYLIMAWLDPSAIERCEQLISIFEHADFFCLCPNCSHTDVPCDQCRHTGWVPRWMAEQLCRELRL
jgi:hypothetical protein